MVEVVGNVRFFLLVAGLLVMLVMGSKWWSFPKVALVAGVWLAVNLVLDVVLRATHETGPDARGSSSRCGSARAATWSSCC